ncbi:MAG TPA: pilus assembly protein TadG-related protein [Nocardioidaceae bacterium]|nr:pilus assembly protein TadG-related protein [Nocardioidaceae bacterium]
MRVQLIGAGRSTKDERGAVAIMVAILSVVLIGVLAFVADFGMAYAHNRSLQNGADAAALAAAQEILEGSSGTDDCGEMVSTTPDASSTATTIFNENAHLEASLAGGGIAVACNDPILPNRVVVTATGEQTSPGFFGGIFGAGDIGLTQTATAVVGPAGTVLGMRPFAVCEAVADLRNTAPTTVVTIDFDNADVGCGTASGNFGTLDIEGGTGSPGTSEVREWIEDGYPDPVSTIPPFSFEGRTGTPSNDYSDQFEGILDDPIVLPVYDVRSGSGSNAIYNITGFVSVQVCAVKLGPSSLLAGDCIETNAITADSSKRFLQFRFIQFIPVGELNTTCELNSACDPGLRVVKLAD